MVSIVYSCCWNVSLVHALMLMMQRLRSIDDRDRPIYNNILYLMSRVHCMNDNAYQHMHVSFVYNAAGSLFSMTRLPFDLLHYCNCNNVPSRQLSNRATSREYIMFWKYCTLHVSITSKNSSWCMQSVNWLHLMLYMPRCVRVRIFAHRRSHTLGRGLRICVDVRCIQNVKGVDKKTFC